MPVSVYVPYGDLFITSVFGCLSAAQASAELVEMTEARGSLCRAEYVRLEQQMMEMRAAAAAWVSFFWGGGGRCHLRER